VSSEFFAVVVGLQFAQTSFEQSTCFPSAARLPDRHEVIMSMSEYEERFRPRAPSLHQVFAMAGGQQRERLLRGRVLVAAAAIGVVIVTCIGAV
jgi:hypothetical protein